MNVIVLRAGKVDSNPRIEKEIMAIHKAGFEVIVLGWDRSCNYPIRRADDLIIGSKRVKRYLIGVKSSFGTGLRNFAPMLSFERRLYSSLSKNRDKFDYIHACDLDTGYVAQLVARRYKKKLIYDIFDYFADSRIMPKLLRLPFAQMENSTINHAHAVIICTEQRRQQIKRTNPRKLIVIENTPKYKQVSKDDRFRREGMLNVSYTGSFGQDRYILEILDAITVDTALFLSIAGAGALESTVENASKKNDRISYLGSVRHDDALRVEASSDVMLALYNPRVPNNRMAAPNKFYEALMLGVPLITNRQTSVGEWVERYGVGIAVNPDFSTEELIDAIHRLSEMNADETITNRCQQLYKDKFNWDNMEKRLVQLYEEL